MNNIFLESLKTSSIDKEINSSLDFQHQLLWNEKEKIVTTLRKELNSCDEFIISVAFITEGGITLFLEELKNLRDKNIKGKILTGDYLNFTHPKALKKLLSFPNIELKLLSNKSFHAKGYFFRKGDIWNIIIGSSNLTQTALTTNFEWNLKISSLNRGKIVEETISEFNTLFNALPKLTLEEIEYYEKRYFDSKKKNINIPQNITITPNIMQEKALKNLNILRKTESKALLISATGTGKTYLSAFDIKAANPKRMLFITHRKVILEKSLYTFKTIIKDRDMGIYSESLDSTEYLFAMIQTLSKDTHLLKYPKDYFEYIVIDEVHHGGAKTYQKILEYFTPKFLLGMTATPERSDNFDIYKLFDNNIAYEIRLHDALKENLLCPFHYFGISDIKVNGKILDEKSTINDLTLDSRVDHILEKSEYYGYSGKTLHGLIFVSRVEEAKILANKLTEKGVLSIALTGENSDFEREKAIEELSNGKIKFIITVDIFNEGVDIPCVNQVILLRPTESSIVYIQQLGRGLRKNKDKEFLVILDFIGNYEKNFLIPVAISQNNSFDKDFMKRFILNGTNFIPGESSISFEEIVKEEIFKNINKSNFATKKFIEQDFNLLEKKLGRTPLLFDFYKNNLIDPSVILKYKTDYDEVLKAIRPKENFGNLNEVEKDFLKFLSTIFTPSKRVNEFSLLKKGLNSEEITLDELTNTSDMNAIMHLSKEIFTSLSTIKNYNPIFIKSKNCYKISNEFYSSYSNNSYFKLLIDDLINYNLEFAKEKYFTESNLLKLYKEYNKMEAFWYLNLDYNNGYQVSGYTFFEKERVVPIFITLDDSSSFTSYDNELISTRTFKWFSKSRRYLKKGNTLTNEGKIAENYYTLHIFIKKKAGDNFYYVGEVEKVISAKEIKNANNEPLVEYYLSLKHEIENELFEYLTM